MSFFFVSTTLVSGHLNDVKSDEKNPKMITFHGGSLTMISKSVKNMNDLNQFKDSSTQTFVINYDSLAIFIFQLST